MSRSVNFLAYQGAWFAAVLGAAAGIGWTGPVAALATAVIRVATAARRGRLVAFLLAALVAGAVVESLLSAGGIVFFPAEAESPWPPLAPPWIFFLWLAFASTLGASLDWLSRRLTLAMVLGGLAGPAAYLAGERLGAIHLGEPLWLVLGVLGLTWGLSTTALVAAAERWLVPPPPVRAGAAACEAR